MDRETFLCALQLQHDDAEEAIRKIRGDKRDGGPPSDQELALRTQIEELLKTKMLAMDRTLAASIYNACVDDGPVIKILEAAEHLASQDHDIARSAGGLSPRQKSEERSVELNWDDDIMERFGTLEIDDNSSEPVEKHEILSLASSSLPVFWETSNHDTSSECVICGETKPTVKVPCGDYYCKHCLLKLFEDSLKDETLFPPRCCRQEIPISIIHVSMDKESRRKFELRAMERCVPDRTYCRNCTAFLLPDSFDGRDAFCSECKTRTCRLCKGISHKGACPEDTGLQELEQLAEQAGWRHCPSCGYLIELKHGCFHITCRCRFQFCYLCSAEWKSCSCPQMDERHLFDRAVAIVNRPCNDGRIPRPANRQEIRRVEQVIRERHGCAHHGYWKKIKGRHQCEECTKTLREFILECEGCLLRACVRCRRNRL